MLSIARARSVGAGDICNEANLCQTDPSLCRSHDHGVCVHTGPNAYRCDCEDGYAGNETFCSDYNECEDSPCENGGSCSDSTSRPSIGIGDFSCNCTDVPGWEGRTCADDVNECEAEPCGDHGMCTDSSTNTSVPIAEFTCACHEGWAGSLCSTDVDECQSNPCANGAACQDSATDGEVSYDAYRCVCSPGFTNGICNYTFIPEVAAQCNVSEGGNCDIDVDECESNPCANDAQCFDSTDASDLCVPTFQDLCAYISAADVDAQDRCNVHPGCAYEDRGTGPTCLADHTNACAAIGNGPNPAENCNADDRCSYNDDVLCEAADAHACASAGGNNAQECLDAGSCTYDAGTSDDVCETVTTADTCTAGAASNEDCVGAGDCVYTADTPVDAYGCVCTSNWYGPSCTDFDECSLSPCQNGGGCTDSTTNGAIAPTEYDCNCSLAPGWTGDNCEDDIDECASTPCENGLCFDSISSNNTVLVDNYTCTCHAGWEGENCNFDVDECAEAVNPCSNDAVCLESNSNSSVAHGQYSCSCAAGFTNGTCNYAFIPQVDAQCNVFEGGSCNVDVDECESNPCANGAACQDSTTDGEVSYDAYRCVCSPGFTNGICNYTFIPEVAAQCDVSEGGNCDIDVDECESNPCANGAACQDSATDGEVSYDAYRCVCSPGFTNGICNYTFIPEVAAQCDVSEGGNCDIDVDECESNPCANDAQCFDSTVNASISFGAYQCTCVAGFTNGVCNVSFTSEYDDSCGVLESTMNSSFSGNCDVDVNECSSSPRSPCTNGAVCQDSATDGEVSYDAYRCVCSPGFTNGICNYTFIPEVAAQCNVSEGGNCDIDVDECQSNPCSAGSCVDSTDASDSSVDIQVLPGAYYCDCSSSRPGWTGDNCEDDIDECASTPCENGLCFDSVSSNDTVPVDNYTCTCHAGWEGENCNFDVDECAEAVNPCSNDAVCLESNSNSSVAHGQYLCVCTFGWAGENCTVVDCSGFLDTLEPSCGSVPEREHICEDDCYAALRNYNQSWLNACADQQFTSAQVNGPLRDHIALMNDTFTNECTLGCTAVEAYNYNASHTTSDFSCVFASGVSIVNHSSLRVVAGHDVRLEIQVHDERGHPSDAATDGLFVDLVHSNAGGDGFSFVPKHAGATTNCEVSRTDVGSYVASGTPLAVGTHFISVRLGNESIIADVNATVATKAPAPIFNATVSESGGDIEVKFDVDTNFGRHPGESDCSNLLPDSSSKLGPGATCAWTDARTLRMFFGQFFRDESAGMLGVDDEIVLSSNVVSADENSLPTNASSVAAPHEIPTPIIVLNAPRVVASCDELVLDASASYNGGGRDLNFTWSLLGAHTVAGEELAAERLAQIKADHLIAALDTHADSVTIERNLSTAVAYEFELTVSNWLGANETVSIEVTKDELPKPQLMLRGPDRISTNRQTDIEISVDASISSCINRTSLNYEWSASNTEISLFRNGTFGTWDQKNLYIAKDVLPAGSTVDLTLRARDPANAELDVFTGVTVVVCNGADPVARVIGGSRSVRIGPGDRLSGQKHQTQTMTHSSSRSVGRAKWFRVGRIARMTILQFEMRVETRWCSQTQHGSMLVPKCA